LQNAAISELVDVNMIRFSNFNEFGSFSTLDMFASLNMIRLCCSNIPTAAVPQSFVTLVQQFQH
jgi:hypothetical protein